MNGAEQRPLFESRHFRTEDGLKLHCRDYAGPAKPAFPVVCLPGLTRNSRDFEALAEHLAARYRVLCLDFRGRGGSEYAPDPMSYVPRSYVRDLAVVLRELGCGPVALIGTSLGGLVSTLFSAIRPHQVLGLVLNDVGPEIDPKGLARIASYVGKTQPVVTWEDAARAVEHLDRIVYPDYEAQDWMRTARRRYIQGADGKVRLDYDLSVAKSLSSPAATPDQWPFVRRLRHIPTMVIRGSVSDILARETTQRMREAVPELKIVEVPNRGHTPTLEEPAALEAIDTFLAALSSRLSLTRRARLALSSLMFQPTARDAGVI
jgi:pimeloyl-ACP methyl ester carboxylesterase